MELALPQVADYFPQVSEVLALTIPAAALISERDVVAESPLIVTAGEPAAQLFQRFVKEAPEGEVSHASSTHHLCHPTLPHWGGLHQH